MVLTEAAVLGKNKINKIEVTQLEAFTLTLTLSLKGEGIIDA